jgi:hypothetical protein
MSKRDMIILMVVTEKPELEIMITDALDAPFNAQGKQHPGWVIFGSSTCRCRC